MVSFQVNNTQPKNWRMKKYMMEKFSYAFLYFLAALLISSCNETETNDENATEEEVEKTDPNIALVSLSEIDGAQDYIELYNAGSETVSLRGAKIRRDRVNDATDDKQTLWEGTTETIAAGAYLCLKYEEGKADVAGNLKRDFSSRKNTHIWLQDANKNVISEFTRGQKSIGWNQIHMQRCQKDEDDAYSYSRIGNNWVYAAPTPGETNGPAVADIDQTMMPVVMNEIDFASGSIELYNNCDDPVNVVGLQLRWSRIKDDEGDNRTIWEALTKTIIPAHGYLVVQSEISLSEYSSTNFHLRLRDGAHNDFCGNNYVWDDFRRGKKGEGWTLVKQSSPIVGSMARVPDGTGDWYIASTPTLGSTNGFSLAGKLVPDADGY